MLSRVGFIVQLRPLSAEIYAKSYYTDALLYKKILCFKLDAYSKEHDILGVMRWGAVRNLEI